MAAVTALVVTLCTPDHQPIGDLIAQTCVVGADEGDLDFNFDFELPRQAPETARN